MKTISVAAVSFCAASLANAAVTHCGVDDFEALGDNSRIQIVDDTLQFAHVNVFDPAPGQEGQPGQGSGAFLDLSDALGSSLSSFLVDTNGDPDGSLFFEFSFLAPDSSNFQEEIGFFLGVPGNPNSSDVTSNTNNGFTLFLNDGTLTTAQSNNSDTDILSSLGVGTEVTISIEYFLVDGMNNRLDSRYNLTATANGAEVTLNDLEGRTGLDTNTINTFDFVASNTGSLVGELTGFKVSDVAIPEPSSVMLSLLALSGFIMRRRRA